MGMKIDLENQGAEEKNIWTQREEAVKSCKEFYNEKLHNMYTSHQTLLE